MSVTCAQCKCASQMYWKADVQALISSSFMVTQTYLANKKSVHKLNLGKIQHIFLTKSRFTIHISRVCSRNIADEI